MENTKEQDEQKELCSLDRKNENESLSNSFLEYENLNGNRMVISNNDDGSQDSSHQTSNVTSSNGKYKLNMKNYPIVSPSYIIKPAVLPSGSRKFRRWLNDHHFENQLAVDELKDLMEHMNIDVTWKSNFAKLLEPENKELQEAFMESKIHQYLPSNQPKYRRKDNWKVAEEMFNRIDRRARALVLKSFKSFSPFIESVENVLMYFTQWHEAPSEIEIARELTDLLVHPIEINCEHESNIQLLIPLADLPFHRLLIHSICQFYGLLSKSQRMDDFQTKVIMIQPSKLHHSIKNELLDLSFSEFIRSTRLSKPEYSSFHFIDGPRKSSLCSDGYCMMDYPVL